MWLSGSTTSARRSPPGLPRSSAFLLRTDLGRHGRRGRCSRHRASPGVSAKRCGATTPFLRTFPYRSPHGPTSASSLRSHSHSSDCSCLPTGPRRPVARVQEVLDGLIIATSLLFASWSTVLGPLYRSHQGGAFKQVVSLAYPVSDVVMVSSRGHIDRQGRKDRARPPGTGHGGCRRVFSG